MSSPSEREAHALRAGAARWSSTSSGLAGPRLVGGDLLVHAPAPLGPRIPQQPGAGLAASRPRAWRRARSRRSTRPSGAGRTRAPRPRRCGPGTVSVAWTSARDRLSRGVRTRSRARARPARHRQPARQRGVAADPCWRAPRAAGFEIDVARARAGPAEPHRPPAGQRPRPPALCMTGHLDTVPLGGAPWSGEPFGELRDGRLYGRGASDMKGGVAAIVVAAERVAALGPRRRGAGAGASRREETGCEGALALADAGALGRAGAVLVAEPTGGVPFVAHKGVLWVEATTEGVSAHGSAPHLGRNAIYPLARAVAALADARASTSRPTRCSATRRSTSARSAAARASTSCPDRARGADRRPYRPRLDRRRRARARCERAAGPEVTLEPWIDLGAGRHRPGRPLGPHGLRGLAPPSRAAWPTSPTPPRSRPPTATRRPSSGAPARPPRPTRPTSGPTPPKIDAAADDFTEVARRWCGV